MSNLKVRKLSIDIERMNLPSQWNGGNAVRTQVFNALSMMFPIGEKYFIDSLAEAEKHPAFHGPAEDVPLFIRQEAIHSALHRRFNTRLHAQGLRNIVEPLIAWRIRLGEHFDTRSKLAITVAYEHFTAVLGNAVLTDASWLDGAAEDVRTLFLWHAAEECEHQAVAFDVYRAMGGGYLRRVLWMLYVTLLLLTDTTVQTVVNLWRSGALWRWKTAGEAARFLFGRGGLFPALVPAWLAWFRPGFTPHRPGGGAAAQRWLERNSRHYRLVPGSGPDRDRDRAPAHPTVA